MNCVLHQRPPVSCLTAVPYYLWEKYFRLNGAFGYSTSKGPQGGKVAMPQYFQSGT